MRSSVEDLKSRSVMASWSANFPLYQEKTQVTTRYLVDLLKTACLLLAIRTTTTKSRAYSTCGTKDIACFRSICVQNYGDRLMEGNRHLKREWNWLSSLWLLFIYQMIPQEHSRHSTFKQVDLRGPLCRLTIVIFSGIGNKIIRWRPFFPKISWKNAFLWALYFWSLFWVSVTCQQGNWRFYIH